MQFTTDTILYFQKDSGTPIFRDEKTIGYLFINTGPTPVEINNFVLTSGTSWKTLEPTMEDKTVYRINFKQNLTQNSCSVDNAQLTVIIYSRL
jgi:hypothetical protein